MSTVINGYTITHPHDPYEDVVSVTINQFDGGGDCWQAQIFADGSLVEGDYFASETEALRWSLREVILMTCVAKAEPV